MAILDFLTKQGRLANRARAESGWRAAELWRQLVNQLDARRPRDRRLLGEALITLGDIAKGQGKLDEAQGWYDQATTQTGCVERHCFTPSTPPAVSVRDALPTVTDSNHEIVLIKDPANETESEERYRRTLAIDPNNVATLCNLGALLHGQGNVAEAEAYYRRALTLDPNDVPTLCNFGLLLRDKGDFAGAEVHYRRALAIDPNDVNTLGNLGALFVWQGDIAEAQTHFQRAVAVNPNDPGSYYNLGILFEDMGDIAEAEVHYRRALAIDPNHVVTLGNLGLLLMGQGDIAGAKKHYRRALAIDPNNVNTLRNLGHVLLGQGDISGAEVYYRRALAISPNIASSYYSLGLLLSHKGDSSGAEAHYRRALAIDPNHVKALCNLGGLLVRQGNVTGATRLFARGLHQADQQRDSEAWGVASNHLPRLLMDNFSSPAFASAFADLLLDLGFGSRLDGCVDDLCTRIESLERRIAHGDFDTDRIAAQVTALRGLALYRAGLACGEIGAQTRILRLVDERTRHAAAELAWHVPDADPLTLSQLGWPVRAGLMDGCSLTFYDMAEAALPDPAWEAALVLEANQAVGQKVALELFSADEALLEQAAPDLLGQLRDVRETLLGLRQQPVAEGRDGEPSEDQLSRLALRIQFDALYEEIARKVPGAALRPTLWRDDLAEALYKYSHLQPVVWLTAAKAGGVAVVLRDGEASMLRLPNLTRSSAAEWSGRLMAVRDLPLSDYRNALDTMLSTLAPWLWRVAMEALAGPLAGAAEAIIIPCGQLAALPWAAARDGQTWWIERDDLPALRFAACAEAAMAASDAMGTEAADTLALFAEPGSELAGLRTLWPDRLRMALSRDELLAAWQHPHRLVHLRCHGAVDTKNPMNSTLTLPDGDVTLRDLMRARHYDGAARQRLVTLASCETAYAGTELPEEPQSFAATLLEAGAGAVVAPLLPVEAEATSTLMAVLHKHYAGGHSPAHALRLAQRAVLATSSISASNPLRSPDPMQGAVRKKIVRATPPGPSAWALMQVYGG